MKAYAVEKPMTIKIKGKRYKVIERSALWFLMKIRPALVLLAIEAVMFNAIYFIAQ